VSDTPLTDQSICRRIEYSGYGVDRIAVDVSYVEVHDCRAIERELRDELAAARADAQRYRWLRHGDNDEYVLHFSRNTAAGFNDVWLPRNEELDAAIDAAMAKEPTDG
jgi:hypothetical protein